MSQHEADVLYRSAYRAAFAYARRLVGPELAEDVAQEVFLRILRYKRDELHRVTLSFVLGVTRNVAFTMRSVRRPESISHPPDRPAAGDHRREPGDDAGMVDWAARRLGALSTGQYEALVMTEVRGLSEEQAGRALHLSRSAVGAKKRTALERLRTEAEPQRPLARTCA